MNSKRVLITIKMSPRSDFEEIVLLYSAFYELQFWPSFLNASVKFLEK